MSASAISRPLRRKLGALRAGLRAALRALSPYTYRTPR